MVKFGRVYSILCAVSAFATTNIAILITARANASLSTLLFSICVFSILAGAFFYLSIEAMFTLNLKQDTVATVNRQLSELDQKFCNNEIETEEYLKKRRQILNTQR